MTDPTPRAIADVLVAIEEVTPAAPALPTRGRVTVRTPLWSPVTIAAASVAAVLLIVGLPLAVFSTMSEPTSDAATAPQSPGTLIVNAEGPTAPASELPDLAQLEVITPLPLPTGAGETEGADAVAASTDTVFAAALIPNPDIWDERVWRSTDHGQTWEEALSLVDEGVGMAIAATDDEVVLLMSNHVGLGGASIYRSTNDGETWQQHDLPAPDGAVGISVSSLANGDETVILGTAWDDTVTESYDDGAVQLDKFLGYRGISWIVTAGEVTGPYDNGQLGHAADATTHDGAYFAVGEQLNEERTPAAWSSPDGATWNTIALPQLPDGWATRGGLDTITSSGSTLLITGETVRGPDGPSEEWATALYVSTDGAQWTLHMVDDMLIRPIAGARGGFIGRAESPDPDTASPARIAHSTDGVSWEYEETGIAPTTGASTDTDIYLAGVNTATGADTLWRLPLD